MVVSIRGGVKSFSTSIRNIATSSITSSSADSSTTPSSAEKRKVAGFIKDNKRRWIESNISDEKIKKEVEAVSKKDLLKIYAPAIKKALGDRSYASNEGELSELSPIGIKFVADNLALLRQRHPTYIYVVHDDKCTPEILISLAKMTGAKQKFFLAHLDLLKDSYTIGSLVQLAGMTADQQQFVKDHYERFANQTEHRNSIVRMKNSGYINWLASNCSSFKGMQDILLKNFETSLGPASYSDIAPLSAFKEPFGRKAPVSP